MRNKPTKADPPKRKRRRFQFSLRSLIVGITSWAAVCAVVPPIAREIRAARRRQAMQVKPLEIVGGPASADDLKNARPVTNEEMKQLVFPPPEKESWFFELFR